MNFQLHRTLVLAVVLAMLLFSVTVQAQHNNDPRDRFSQRVAGSSVIAAYLGVEPSLPVQAMATLAADGGVVATDTDDYGFDIVEDFHGAKHGNWERTGKREITLSIYEFGYSATTAKGYTPIVVYKLTFVVTFEDESMAGGSGTVSYAAHALPALDSNADPLDLESGFVVAVGEGTVEFARMAL